MFPPALWWPAVLWLAFLGGCIGSFMNVVVYRLPAGKSLLHPGSACPACKLPIRWYHNIPVFGWLILRGRCYECGAAISPRYPIVEAIVAALFVALAIVEPLGPGSNLPVSPLNPIDIDSNGFWVVYGFHLLLLCTMFCLVLIEFDRNATFMDDFPDRLMELFRAFQQSATSPADHRPILWRRFNFDRMPAVHKMFLLVWLVGWSAPLVWPFLRPVGIGAAIGDTFDSIYWLVSLIAVLLVAGAVRPLFVDRERVWGSLCLFLILLLIIPDPRIQNFVVIAIPRIGEGTIIVLITLWYTLLIKPGFDIQELFGMAPRFSGANLLLVGTFLGWQSAAALACAATLVYLLAAMFRPIPYVRQYVTWSNVLLLLTAAWVFFWNRIVDLAPSFSFDAGWRVLLAASAMTFVLSVATRWVIHWRTGKALERESGDVNWDG